MPMGVWAAAAPLLLVLEATPRWRMRTVRISTTYCWNAAWLCRLHWESPTCTVGPGFLRLACATGSITLLCPRHGHLLQAAGRTMMWIRWQSISTTDLPVAASLRLLEVHALSASDVPGDLRARLWRILFGSKLSAQHWGKWSRCLGMSELMSTNACSQNATCALRGCALTSSRARGSPTLPRRFGPWSPSASQSGAFCGYFEASWLSEPPEPTW